MIKLSALFAFRCQKYSVRKLKLYDGVEYKIFRREHFLNKK